MYKIRLVLDAVFSVLVLSLHGLGQSLMLQVAKKASVLKRRKSRNRMEAPPTPQGDVPTTTFARRDSDGDGGGGFSNEDAKCGNVPRQ